MIVDANVLLCAVAQQSPHHRAAAAWLDRALAGGTRVGLPWQTIGAFLRISTHPRIPTVSLTPGQAHEVMEGWLRSPAVWVPPATERTVAIYTELALRHHVTGNLVTDAQLAALALEYGVAVVSADSDFARFTEVRWINPLTERTKA